MLVALYCIFSSLVTKEDCTKHVVLQYVSSESAVGISKFQASLKTWVGDLKSQSAKKPRTSTLTSIWEIYK